jgi:hypothetical protein
MFTDPPGNAEITVPRDSDLVRDCNDILARIDAFCASGRGRHRKRAGLRRDLVKAVALYEGTPDSLRRSIRYSWNKFDRKHWERCAQLSLALLLHLGRRMSLRHASAMVDLPMNQATFALRLIRSTMTELKALRVLEEHEAIRSWVDGHLEKVKVLIEPRAIEDLLLAAAETYVVPARGKGNGFTECYGVCYGSRRDHAPFADGRFRRTVHVSRIVTQLRARANAHEVYPNAQSAKIHGEVADKLFSHLSVVGDYHTHPYKSLTRLRSVRGWEYSDADQEHVGGWIDEQREVGHDPRFSLVVAVAHGKREGKPVAPARNRVRVCLGRVFLEIAAYRILHDRTYDDDIDLELPSATMNLVR